MRDFLKDLIVCIALLGFAIALVTCTDPPTDLPSHNARGGYVDACGDQPGMIGDDC